MKPSKEYPQQHRINKVLIANRGEIALRIKKAADKLGIQSCLVVSQADQSQSYVTQFESIKILPGSTAAETYLNQAVIIEAAKSLGADAIHPGYGFLSENAQFAKAVTDSGLIFIGPKADTIENLGSKTAARNLVTSVGVPVVPGTQGGLTDKELIKVAKEKIGLPLLIKATAGGGGRGMKIVRTWDELPQLLERARAEAKKFFSNDDVFIERYVENPRHIEVQLFGDNYGNVVQFGTRDCSAQRRYQKVIEEAPAVILSDSLRSKIHQAALSAAKAANYSNAGTAEFIVSGNDFYFLEINTRIQVEHPVTEQAYQEDLVELQFKVAMGYSLQNHKINNDPKFYSIELRIYAEDPSNFTPSLGQITHLSHAEINPNRIRLEMGFKESDEVLPYYDAMIGKLIVTGSSRLQTIDYAYDFLKTFRIEGIGTNITFLKWLLCYKPFRDGTLSIQQIERDFKIEFLSDIQKREVVDQKWIESSNDTETIEHVHVSSNSGNLKSQTIKVIHRADRTFVFIPLNKDGSELDHSLWRRSNSYQNGLKAVQGLLES
jgi:acetyl/propionyl-CoA carboxylase alpha subunit